MIVGDQSGFAILFEISDEVDDWVLGRFGLCFSGRVIGNYDDASVDLQSCFYWLDELIGRKDAMYEPGLYELSDGEVFRRVADPVFCDGLDEYYEGSYSRFHFSHIGMSSFDDVVLLIVYDGVDNLRFIWREGGGDIISGVVGCAYFSDLVRESLGLFKSSCLKGP